MTGLATFRPATRDELRDPKFCSYAKSLTVGEKPILCQCADCNGEALIMPTLTMASMGGRHAIGTGTLICPRCWHPVIGRILWTVAHQGGRSWIAQKRYRDAIRILADIGLLKRGRGHWYQLTPAGMAVLWVKERVGWEFESAHTRGEYRTERLPGTGGGYAAGYWEHSDCGRWIHHRWAPAGKVWPIKGVGVLHFVSSAPEGKAA